MSLEHEFTHTVALFMGQMGFAPHFVNRTPTDNDCVLVPFTWVSPEGEPIGLYVTVSGHELRKHEGRIPGLARRRVRKAVEEMMDQVLGPKREVVAEAA